MKPLNIADKLWFEWQGEVAFQNLRFPQHRTPVVPYEKRLEAAVEQHGRDKVFEYTGIVLPEQGEFKGTYSVLILEGDQLVPRYSVWTPEGRVYKKAEEL